MTGRFEINRAVNGQFKFCLKADNGEIILTSELYNSKFSVENGIESVRHNCSIYSRYEIRKATNGKYFFNLHAANYQIIGTSQMYSSEELLNKGIKQVMQIGETATVKHLF